MTNWQRNRNNSYSGNELVEAALLSEDEDEAVDVFLALQIKKQ